MKRLVAWFAENTVAANLLMIVILAGGILTLPSLRFLVIPEIEPNIITVTVPYPGAAPEEVEKGVCVRVEEAVQDLSGVRRITSRAVEGAGVVTIELIEGTDRRKALDDVKSRVDAITTFPEETESPVVQLLDLRRQVINVAVSGDLDEASLRRLADRVRDDLSARPGITQVEVSNARPYEISIEVSEESLRRHRLTFDDLARAVRRSSLDVPGGTIRAEGGEILVRTEGQAYRGREFEEIVLLTRADGTRVKLGDVATVRDAFAETDRWSRFDGKPALLVQVFRVGDQSALHVSDEVKRYVEESKAWLPEGTTLTTWSDDARILRGRLDLMMRNGLFGLVLVFLCLALFLRMKLAFWVAVGIPTAFLGAVWFLPGMDVSINLLSLFAFIVTLGIVVDDAIVVSENIYTHTQLGKDGLRAAVDGTHEVAIPVVLAVTTTIAAFSPMLGLPGTMGQFARAIPIIVILCLSVSLVESLFVLPAHLRHLNTGAARTAVGRGWIRFQGWFSGGLQRFIDRVYRPVLGFSVRWRYATLAVGASALLVLAGLGLGGYVKFLFFPPVEADNIVATLTMPEGTPAHVTEAAVRQIEAAARQLEAEYGKGRLFRHVLSSIGGQPFQTEMRNNAGSMDTGYSGGHLAEVNIELIPAEERTVSSSALAARWRELTGRIPGAVELAFHSNLMASGADVDLELSAPDLETLRAAAGEVKAKLGEYDGVSDIGDSYRAGKEELKLRLRPSAETLGLAVSDLGRQVRQGFYGEEAQRILRGRDEVKVMVRYDAAGRKSIDALEEMRIRLPDGVEVPFRQVAEVEYGRGPSVIDRADRRRALRVTANVDPARANANEVLADLRSGFLPALQERYPGLRVSFEGQQREQREMMEGIRRGILLALLMIFAILAIAFRSYLQPAIIMVAIPFGVGGAVLAHVLLGMDVTMLSLIGIMALIGVVVNDSLVMIDFVNRARAGGATAERAVRDSGPLRFRPILLTSLTTFAGLTPMLLERSMQARFLIPMAVSLGFGVMFATVITLFIIPCVYLVLEDLKGGFRRLFGRPAPPPEA